MSRLPSTGPSLQRYLRQQARTAQRQQQSSAFARSGTSVTAENVTEVDGTLNVVGALVVDGTETVNGPLVVHGTAAFDGTTTIGGNASITGTLSLPAGIIDNAALANPVVPAQAFLGANTFALSVAGANIVTITRNTPAGFTSVVVNAYGRVAAVNSTASLDAVYCAVDVNGTGGSQFGMPVAAGSFGSLSAGYCALLTGLSAGSPVAAHLFASTSFAGWASNVANGADLSVTFLWFR